MESTTFEFKSEMNMEQVYDALEGTEFQFAIYGFKSIIVWRADAFEFVRNYCKERRIAVTEL